MHDQLGFLIGGKWIPGSGRRSLSVVNPATEAEIGRVPVAEKGDLDAALEAADRGFNSWRHVLPQDRARVVRRFASLLRDRADQLAATMTAEQGKPLAEAKTEVLAAAELCEWLSEEARRIYGRIVPSRLADSRILVTHEPVGPVAAFSPWNFPCMMPARKIAHALAAGCSIVLKPAEETPGTAVLIGKICQEAGVPDDVVNIVFGEPAEVSEHLITSPIIKKVSLTGSVPVGKQIAGLAARGLKRVTLELGGHSPTIIFNDADIERAVSLCSKSRFRNAGQVCTAPTRFFVQAGVFEKFSRLFTEYAKSIVVGDGADPRSQMGPLANKRRVDAMTKFVEDAVQRGATVAAGGARLGDQGFYYAPTVLHDVPPDAQVMQREPFGPLAPMILFEATEEAMIAANSLPYGLAAYVFTGSHRTAAEVSANLKAGVVAINGATATAPEAPFGGIGDSGIGRESGAEGLIEYTNIKTITETFV